MAFNADDYHDQYRQLVKIFRAIDVDHDGEITGEEMAAFFRSKDPMVPFFRKRLSKARPVVKKGNLFDALDTDGSHSVTEEEFVATLYVPHWEVVSIFRDIDDDGDNEITSEELREFLAGNGKKSSKASIDKLKTALKRARPVAKGQKLFNCLDKNHDGSISLQEWVRALTVEHWDLVEMFRTIDKDGSGEIDAKELHSFLHDVDTSKVVGEMNENDEGMHDVMVKKHLIQALKDARPQHVGAGEKHKTLFACLDAASPDGKITVSDFVDALYLKNHHLVDIFRQIDTDGDDIVSKEELTAFFKSKSPYVKKFREELALSKAVKKGKKLYKVLDRDGDGYVSKREFVAALSLKPPPDLISGLTAPALTPPVKNENASGRAPKPNPGAAASMFKKAEVEADRLAAMNKDEGGSPWVLYGAVAMAIAGAAAFYAQNKK